MEIKPEFTAKITVIGGSEGVIVPKWLRDKMDKNKTYRYVVYDDATEAT
jgi:hypothetical protein